MYAPSGLLGTWYSKVDQPRSLIKKVVMRVAPLLGMHVMSPLVDVCPWLSTRSSDVKLTTAGFGAV
jgi:hypothetical protein